jgi:alpha-glucoside transport system permease protein
VLAGNVLEGRGGRVTAFGTRIQDPGEFPAGTTAETHGGGRLTIEADGRYELVSPEPFEGRSPRLFYTAALPPKFTLANYYEVLASEGLGQSFINSLTVTVPATIIPILIAAYAAYALAWMKFPGRPLILAAIVGLLVVPLQMSLIPLLRLYNDVGAFLGVPAKTYLGIWLAHTGFGLPLAIYLLRNYIAGLPQEIMESARIDGATDFEIFLRIVLPLSLPALASFAIFQFLWVWNDLLVAMVFLGQQSDQLVLTGKLRALLGSHGDNWEVLTASAFISIVVPLIVFFALQRYLVRGLLAGSVKGG